MIDLAWLSLTFVMAFPELANHLRLYETSRHGFIAPLESPLRAVQARLTKKEEFHQNILRKSNNSRDSHPHEDEIKVSKQA